VLVTATVEPKASDAALVRAAQGGDRAAFAVLYEQYAPLTHGILLAHVSYTAAEDLMQDVWVKVLERLPLLREPAAFGGWLASIARHAAADHHRQAKPTIQADDMMPDETRRDDDSFAVLAIIQGLPQSYRETLILRLVEGMTGPEIAARTGLTPDSVRVNLCRGMKMLRRRLEVRSKR
jgi:RNA polymerase sigma-70 factor, ECF subfamily